MSTSRYGRLTSSIMMKLDTQMMFILLLISMSTCSFLNENASLKMRAILRQLSAKAQCCIRQRELASKLHTCAGPRIWLRNLSSFANTMASRVKRSAQTTQSVAICHQIKHEVTWQRSLQPMQSVMKRSVKLSPTRAVNLNPPSACVIALYKLICQIFFDYN